MCVQSTNYPNGYPNDVQCTVTINQAADIVLSEEFDVEKNFDRLVIVGELIDGDSIASVPSSLNPGDQITWQSDSTVTSTGWQVCFPMSSGKFSFAFQSIHLPIELYWVKTLFFLVRLL